MAYFAKLGPGNVVLEVHRVVNDVIIDKFPENVVGYWCKVLNTIVIL